MSDAKLSLIYIKDFILYFRKKMSYFLRIKVSPAKGFQKLLKFGI